MPVRMDTHTWTIASGEPFRVVTWKKEGADAVLVIHHGLGEHAGRYQAFADGLADRNLSIVSFDARGHGESVGRKGDGGTFSTLADDFIAIFPHLVESTGGTKVALMGHSMGGALAAYTLTTRGVFDERIDAFLASAPAVQVTLRGVAKMKASVGRLLNKINPSMTLANTIDPSVISSDASEVRRYIEDPLVHDQISARLAMSLLDDAPKALDAAGKIGLPTLLWHGQEDRLVDIDGTRALAKKIGATDKTLHEFPNMRHETHHETLEARQKVFDVVGEWLAERGLA